MVPVVNRFSDLDVVKIEESMVLEGDNQSAVAVLLALRLMSEPEKENTKLSLSVAANSVPYLRVLFRLVLLKTVGCSRMAMGALAALK